MGSRGVRKETELGQRPLQTGLQDALRVFRGCLEQACGGQVIDLAWDAGACSRKGCRMSLKWVVNIMGSFREEGVEGDGERNAHNVS